MRSATRSRQHPWCKSKGHRNEPGVSTYRPARTWARRGTVFPEQITARKACFALCSPSYETRGWSIWSLALWTPQLETRELVDILLLRWDCGGWGGGRISGACLELWSPQLATSGLVYMLFVRLFVYLVCAVFSCARRFIVHCIVFLFNIL